MATRDYENTVWEVPVCRYGTVYVPYSEAKSAEQALEIVKNQAFKRYWLDENDFVDVLNDPDEIELVVDTGLPF